ncbi:MAG: DUF418 domain-containing protein [Pseudomonadota bacterium]
MTAASGPLGENGRVGELDALRGFALLGVFIVHFVGINYWELPMDDAVREAWQGSIVYGGAGFMSDFLFYDKANTLFATLFGMGFWVMMTRLKERGADFERVYLRRLGVLFLIGLINWIFIFPWDVLHDYAIAGLILFLLRNLSVRAMLVTGLILTIGSAPLANQALSFLAPDVSGEATATYHGETYFSWITMNVRDGLQRDVVDGVYLSWLPYVLGRFLLGAWVIRAGWLEVSPERNVVIGRLCVAGLLIGLLIELTTTLIVFELIPLPMIIDTFIHAIGGPLLALGYACGLVLLFRSNRWNSVARYFSPVGKTALTAYVIHGIVFVLIYYPFAFGLAGIVTPVHSVVIALAVFATVQAAASTWLRRYRFGPLEYLWRWATYGQRPAFRIVSNTAAA